MNGRSGRETPMLTLRYDAEVDALYLLLHEGIAATTVEIEESVYVDLDGEGRPLGVEFVSGADFLPFLQRRGGEFVVAAPGEAPVASVVRHDRGGA